MSPARSASAHEPAVYIVDDDKAVRESLCWLIETVGLPVHAFPTAQAFLDLYNPAWNGCLVLDLRLPGMGGLELQQALNRYGPHLPIIIITAHGDVPAAVQSLQAGAFDFIEKPFSDQTLLERVRVAIEMDASARKRQTHQERIAHRIDSLTPRERQVMKLIVEGKLNKQVATLLNLSQKTVEAHRASLMVKMQAANIADLVSLVLQSHRPRA